LGSLVSRRVFVIATDGAACWFYRLHLPLSTLDPDKFQIIWGAPDVLCAGDIVVGQRIAGPNEAWLEMCARRDVTTVYELDDNLLEIDPVNVVPHSIYAPIAESTAANIAAASLVSVSTPKLADRIRPLNPNVVVLPNCMPSSFLCPHARQDERLVVGWGGSMFHGQDFEGVAEQLSAFGRAEPRAQFATLGADHIGNGVAHSSGGWTTVEQYIGSLNFDIGIAPLKKSIFTDCKSHLKVLEYGARGIPAVAADVGEYGDWIEHGVNGFVYSDVAELAGYLQQMADDRLRFDMGLAAFERAQQFVITNQIHLWEQAFQEA
jgi:Glycosyl transferases group 1